jgi:2,4-dienoyl-CoA reductase-like NADH-dependent reductase (Old Yellow Enzyme family)
MLEYHVQLTTSGGLFISDRIVIDTHSKELYNTLGLWVGEQAEAWGLIVQQMRVRCRIIFSQIWYFTKLSSSKQSMSNTDIGTLGMALTPHKQEVFSH